MAIKILVTIFGKEGDILQTLLLSALLFRAAAVPGKSREEIWEITFEIDMFGQHGLEINEPPGESRPVGTAGEGVLGVAVHMHHVCRFQEDRAGMDICVGLGEEWGIEIYLLVS